MAGTMTSSSHLTCQDGASLALLVAALALYYYNDEVKRESYSIYRSSDTEPLLKTAAVSTNSPDTK